MTANTIAFTASTHLKMNSMSKDCGLPN